MADEQDKLGRTDASTERRAPAGESEADPLRETGYRALALIAAGANSEVYAAEHLKLDKLVVVKILRQQLARAPDTADRMRLEAQALARLAHDHVVKVVDCGVAAGRPFFVMEHLTGRALKEELAARRSLPVTEALDIACQTLDGLTQVHRQGLVHRDINPANLFLCEPEQYQDRPGGRRIVKILDFDVLKILDQGDKLGLSPQEHSTGEGASLGAPRYCAPEQGTSQPVDERADIYAVGAVLYRMLAGRDPFAHHESLTAAFRAKQEETPTLIGQWTSQSIPPPLEKLVQWALKPDPANRPESAAEFAIQLRAVAEHLGRPAPAVKNITAARPAPEPAAEQQTRGPMASRQGLQPGQTCGTYEIVHEIGRGAMGVVYLARNEHGDERALKLLQLTARVGGDLAERFEREVQLLSFVDHVHVARFYEAGTIHLAGRPTLWIALEYVQGRYLREIIAEQSPLAVDLVQRWGRQIAQGVHEGHKLGVVHRDLKPENIAIVSTDDARGDVAKVFDFGIAKYRQWGVRSTDLRRKLGTVPYMSPEQLDGSRDLDARSDVFTLGLVLYELATGQHPFAKPEGSLDVYEAILRQVTMAAKPLATVLADFPPHVSAIVHKAMAKDPDKRFRTMAELAEALDEGVTGRGQTPAVSTATGQLAAKPGAAGQATHPVTRPLSESTPLRPPRSGVVGMKGILFIAVVAALAGAAIIASIATSGSDSDPPATATGTAAVTAAPATFAPPRSEP